MPTQKEQMVLWAIGSYWEEFGHGPSIRELVERTFYASTSSINRVLDKLEQQQLVARGKPGTMNAHRAIHIINGGDNLGHMYIVIGPPAAGKSTLVDRLVKEVPGIAVAVGYTSRPMRAGEEPGRPYKFVTPEWFESKLAHGEFSEHVIYDGHHYGLDKYELESKLAMGDVLVVLEKSGTAQVMEKYPAAMRVFLLPPSMTELRGRMAGRELSEQAIENRLQRVTSETEYATSCELVVMPGSKEQVFAVVREVVMMARANEAVSLVVG